MKRIHTKQKAVLMTGLGILFTFGAVVPAFAGNVSASITDTGSSVGIGTTTPTARLDIAGGAGGSLRFSGNAGTREIEFTGTGGFELFQTTSNSLQLGTNNLPRMTISASGNVGIGTTTPGVFNLYVAAPTQMTAFGSTANGTRSLLQFYAKDGGGVLRGRMLGYDPVNQNMVLDAGGDGTANNVVINNVGNVGIGAPSPSGKLHVIGGNSGGAGNGNQVVRFEDTVGSGLAIDMGGVNNSYGWIRAQTVGVGERNLVLQPLGGNVGIGTAKPGTKLQVVGNIRAGAGLTGIQRVLTISDTGNNTAVGLAATGTSGRNWNLTATDAASSGNLGGNPGAFMIYDGTADATRVTIDSAGNVGIGTRTPAAKLNVEGPYPQLILNNPSAGAGDQILFRNAGTAAGFIGHQNSAAKLQFSSKDASVAHMTIDDNGNVGIGTTGPQDKLDVEGGSIVVNRYAGHSASGLYLSSTIGPTHYNWMITAQDRVSGALEFGPSTAPGITTWAEPVMVIHQSGNVSIGVRNPGAYKLAVKGKIRAEEVVVDTGWADFVFKKNYDLMPLEKVAKHIEEAGHLPGIPTEKEVQENGISIGQIQSKLLQKIEEMTLYVIELKKENDRLKERVSALENQSL